jgi:hypothetical protein
MEPRFTPIWGCFPRDFYARNPGSNVLLHFSKSRPPLRLKNLQPPKIFLSPHALETCVPPAQLVRSDFAEKEIIIAETAHHISVAAHALAFWALR